VVEKYMLMSTFSLIPVGTSFGSSTKMQLRFGLLVALNGNILYKNIFRRSKLVNWLLEQSKVLNTVLVLKSKLVNWLAEQRNTIKLVKASIPVRSEMLKSWINKLVTTSASLLRILPFYPLVSYPSSISLFSKFTSGIRVVCARPVLGSQSIAKKKRIKRSKRFMFFHLELV
jgi:hypothetical protein